MELLLLMMLVSMEPLGFSATSVELDYHFDEAAAAAAAAAVAAASSSEQAQTLA